MRDAGLPRAGNRRDSRSPRSLVSCLSTIRRATRCCGRGARLLPTTARGASPEHAVWSLGWSCLSRQFDWRLSATRWTRVVTSAFGAGGSEAVRSARWWPPVRPSGGWVAGVEAGSISNRAGTDLTWGVFAITILVWASCVGWLLDVACFCGRVRGRGGCRWLLLLRGWDLGRPPAARGPPRSSPALNVPRSDEACGRRVVPSRRKRRRRQVGDRQSIVDGRRAQRF